MSAKKTNSKKTSTLKRIIWVLLALIVVIFGVLLIRWYLEDDRNEQAVHIPGQVLDVTVQESSDAAVQDGKLPPAVSEDTQVVGTMEDIEIVLGECLQLINIGSYTGAFVEDGTNEIVSGVLMLVVTNISESDLQYAEITLPTESGEAKFSISTLPAGESAVLLEQNRMAYTGQEDIAKAEIANVAAFDSPLSLCEDQIRIQILDGAINVTNISGQDITGDLIIYYKNAATDLYYGGITYRVRIQGGIKADEIKQIMASHFSDTGSKIMFVTVG